ncbi:hypothetical protein ABZ650_20435 [Streptomyces griseoviridis]|uniref:hypothetical protein n=1 Tax=Streptomyces griseoviridis TaxID=45398 RepID=UPI0033F72FA5
MADEPKQDVPDRWLQQIRDDETAHGRDPDDVRIIVGHQNPDGSYGATELQRPPWMNGGTPSS